MGGRVVLGKAVFQDSQQEFGQDALRPELAVGRFLAVSLQQPRKITVDDGLHSGGKPVGGSGIDLIQDLFPEPVSEGFHKQR